MAVIPKVIIARRITPPVEMIWFDKENHAEVAAWLQRHGVQTEILFPRTGGMTLIIGTSHITLAEDVPGVYVRPDGQRVTLEEYDKNWLTQRVIR